MGPLSTWGCFGRGFIGNFDHSCLVGVSWDIISSFNIRVSIYPRWNAIWIIHEESDFEPREEMKHVLVLLTHKENMQFSISRARQLITTLASFLLRSNTMKMPQTFLRALIKDIICLKIDFLGIRQRVHKTQQTLHHAFLVLISVCQEAIIHCYI